MPVELEHIRDLLLPGLWAVQGHWLEWSIVQDETTWGKLFVPQTPHLWIPKLTVAETVVAAAAVTLAKNPVVTRRFWSIPFTA